MEQVNAVEIHTPSSGVPQVAANTAVTPMEMLDRALSTGADIETLTKLMALQERWEANQARKAFDAAIAEAKAKIPPITRNATGHNQKKYADFAAIASVVDPILSEFGLSYRFKTAQADKINVTCVLSHKDGHSEETTLSGGADTSGSKNAIQAIGSTLTYLQRYSLTAALGLAASTDDDGKASGSQDIKFITEKQVMEIRDLIAEVGADEKKFCSVGKVERLEDIPSDQYSNAVNMLKRKGQAA